METLSRRSVIGLALAGLSPLARAQGDWPSKPLLLVLGFPPRRAERSGRQGDVAAAHGAAQAAGRGRQPTRCQRQHRRRCGRARRPRRLTFLYNSSSLALSTALYRSLPVDPQRDLVPVNGAATLPLVCIVESSFPANNFREWAAHLKANPGRFNYGSPGAGNLAHVAAAMLLKANGLQAVHVPYKGSSEALQSLIGGSTQFQFDSVNSPLALIKAGRLKPLFVTSAQRSPVLPDVPTLAESGAQNIAASAWQGVMAPAKTSPAIVNRMATEIAKAMASAEMKTALAAQGAYSIANTPERYAAFFAEEIDCFKKTVDDLGLKLD